MYGLLVFIFNTIEIMLKLLLFQTLSKLKSLWRQTGTVATNIGGLAAAVFLLHRTSTAVTSSGYRRKTRTSNPAEVVVPSNLTDDGH